MPPLSRNALVSGHAVEAAAAGAAHSSKSRIPEEDAVLFTTPPDLTCPITHDLFVDPVINAMGQIYDRAAIENSMSMRLVDPVTNLPLPSTSLTSVHLIRSRALEYREATARACTQKLLSGSCRAPVEYLRRAAELCHGVGSMQQCAPGGMTPAVAAYVMAHGSNTYDSLVLERFAEGLREQGLIDEATQLYLRLLEFGEGDAPLQARVLKSCMACWADEHGQTDKESLLLRLAAFVERQHSLSTGQVLDALLEDESREPLALALCEFLLASMDSEAGGDGGGGCAAGGVASGRGVAAASAFSSSARQNHQLQPIDDYRQGRRFSSLLLKYVQLRLKNVEARLDASEAASLAAAATGGQGSARDSPAGNGSRDGQQQKRLQDALNGSGLGRKLRRSLGYFRGWIGTGLAAGVFAMLSVLPGDPRPPAIIKIAKAGAFLLAVQGPTNP